MSAHHSRHINNKSVHPEWLLPPQLEEREGEAAAWFLPNYFKPETEDGDEEFDKISRVMLKFDACIMQKQQKQAYMFCLSYTASEKVCITVIRRAAAKDSFHYTLICN